MTGPGDARGRERVDLSLAFREPPQVREFRTPWAGVERGLSEGRWRPERGEGGRGWEERQGVYIVERVSTSRKKGSVVKRGAVVFESVETDDVIGGTSLITDDYLVSRDFYNNLLTYRLLCVRHGSLIRIII